MFSLEHLIVAETDKWRAEHGLPPMSPSQQMALGGHIIGVFKGGRLIAADDEVYAAPDNWLDEQDFYEICQVYRHARDPLPIAPGFLNAAEAFEQLKQYIRERMNAAPQEEPNRDHRAEQTAIPAGAAPDTPLANDEIPRSLLKRNQVIITAATGLEF